MTVGDGRCRRTYVSPERLSRLRQRSPPATRTGRAIPGPGSGRPGLHPRGKRATTRAPLSPVPDLQPPSFSPALRDGLRDLLTWRRDVRSFRREPLPEGTLEELITAACLSPSVGLSEPWRFVNVDDPVRRTAVRANFATANAEALAAQASDRQAAYAKLKLAGLDDAPVHLAAFADPGDTQGHGLGRRTMIETIDYSVAIAIHTLWLAARAEAIGLGWVSILDPDTMTRVLDVPEHWRFVGYLCLGYPAAVDNSPALQRAGWETRRDPSCRLLQR